MNLLILIFGSFFLCVFIKIENSDTVHYIIIYWILHYFEIVHFLQLISYIFHKSPLLVGIKVNGSFVKNNEMGFYFDKGIFLIRNVLFRGYNVSLALLLHIGNQVVRHLNMEYSSSFKDLEEELSATTCLPR